MNNYAWAITRDVLHQQDSICRSGVIGPKQSSFWSEGLSAEEQYEQVVNHADRRKFKLYDADGILYYEGYLVGGEGHEPLDDFGMPDSGCTEIRLDERACCVCGDMISADRLEYLPNTLHCVKCVDAHGPKVTHDPNLLCAKASPSGQNGWSPSS